MQATEFVHSYLDAWNHSDAVGVANHLSKNGTYLDVPNDDQYSPGELVSMLAEFFASEHHQYELTGDVLSNDYSVAFQYKMSSGHNDTTYRCGAEFISFQGDGAVLISDYYDPTYSKSIVNGLSNAISSQKYAKSGLASEQLDSYKERLVKLMAEQKVYLDPEITLPSLAQMVGCSINHLSQAVNSGFSMSFFDFLNSYRIDEAKSILLNQSSLSKSILDVSFASGFNSNSAFYAAFKKSTGQTPAQFRRSIQGLSK